MDITYNKNSYTTLHNVPISPINIDAAKLGALQALNTFVKPYGLDDARVKLKYDHSIRVAELARRIAIKNGLDPRSVTLAWIAGLLHDVGRFEQLRLYDTFNDAVYPHADLSMQILSTHQFNLFVDPFQLSAFEQALILDAVRCHAAASVEYDTTIKFPKDYQYEKTWLHHVVRDADKIDIIAYVPDNMDICCEASLDYLKTDRFNPELIEHLEKKEPMADHLMKKGIDYIARYTSFSYQLIYPASKQILRKQGDIYRMLEFKSLNPETMESFKKLRAFVDKQLLPCPE